MMRIDDEGALQAERISGTGGGASEQVGAQRRAVGSVYWGCPGMKRTMCSNAGRLC